MPLLLATSLPPNNDPDYATEFYRFPLGFVFLDVGFEDSFFPFVFVGETFGGQEIPSM